jgi:rare lipoprotein A
MRKLIFLILPLLFLAFSTQSCNSKKAASAKTVKGKVFKKKAVACYYHDKYNGRKTASGEKFSNSKMTAAHKKLAFGTRVKVTNLANNKSVIVTINDRGPFTKGREIDLSKKAFMEITHNKNLGLLDVSIEILD